jgi:hypothetical protein
MHQRDRLTVAAAIVCAGLVGTTQAAEAPPSGLPVAAAAGCWLVAPSSGELAQKLAHCQSLGVDLVTLQVQADAAQEPQACEPGGQDCLPLAQLPALLDAKTRLLLQAPPALLDAVQAQLGGSALAGRLWVQPQVQRPQAAQALDLAPGVSYRREPRLQPRPVMLHVLQIAAGTSLGYVTTPQPPGVSTPGEGYPALRTSTFLQQQGLLAAINGTYFRPFNGGKLMQEAYVPAAGQAVQISTAQAEGSGADAVYRSKDSRVNGVLCAGGSTLLPSRTRCPAGTELLLASGPMLLEAGQLSSLKAHTAPEKTDASGLPPYYREAHPRTAVAVNRQTGMVWWVVADGRQPGYSEGLSLPELATLLQELGATDAINLDGGGSSTMALSVLGQPQLMNSPIHTAIPGRERPVANHLGLRLLPQGGAQP